MSISAKQLAANQRNAKNSTGPKTPEGKARSSQNATRHGLLSQHAVITVGDCADTDKTEGIIESQEAFDLHLEGLRESFKPATHIEDLLVEQIALCYWKMARFTRMDKRLFSQSMRHPSILAVDLVNATCLQRYERNLQHTLDRSLAHLERIQKARQEAEARASAAEEFPKFDFNRLAGLPSPVLEAIEERLYQTNPNMAHDRPNGDLSTPPSPRKDSLPRTPSPW
jgi:hypothetical protein